MMTRAAVLALLFVTGCGTGQGGSPTEPRTATADTCNAAAYQGMVGQDAVAALSIPDPKRSFRPDEAVTLDFDPARVSIRLSETDVIVAIECG